MFIFESNILETFLFVFLVLVLLLFCLRFLTIRDSFESCWNHLKSVENPTKLIGVSVLLTMMCYLGFFSVTHLVMGFMILSLHSDWFEPGWNYLSSVISGGTPAQITGASVLTFMMFVYGSISSALVVLLVLMFSSYLLNIAIVRGSIELGWNRFKSVIPGDDHAKIIGASVLMITMILLGLCSMIHCIIWILILSLHQLNVPIVTHFFESVWNHFKSIIPGENHPNVIGVSVLVIMMFFLGSVSSVVLVLGVEILSVHLISLSTVRESLRSNWNHFRSVIPGENHVKVLKASVLIIMMFVFGSVSSALVVLGVLTSSSFMLNITVVTDSIKPGWNYLKSVFQRENLEKMKIKTFIFESKSSVTLLVIVVLIFSVVWLNFTVLTDLFLSGWSFSRSVVPGLYLVETLGTSVLTITTFVFGSYSSTVLVIGVLMLSVHLVKFTTVRDSTEPGWNPFIPGGTYVKILGASIVTITMFVFVSVSSALLVLVVLIFSSYVLNITVVRDSFNSFWNRFSSVISVYIVETIDGRGRLANVVRERSTLLTPQTGSLPVYKIPLKEKQTDSKGYKYYSFGKKSTKPSRTIVLLGATGEEKSRVISGMINYILGVKWKDSYRFTLEDEGQVTMYKIYHQTGFKIDYSLTIVDTPGFGDSEDKQVSEQLRKLFYSLHDVGEIDAVCFVAPAALTGLTPTQKCVFDSILSIFGKDVAGNIRILVTSADHQLPPVLEAIRASGVSCPSSDDGLPLYFKFNTSALFADSTSAHWDQMFWNMGTSSLMSFFTALVCIKTFKLTLTAEVLGDRWQVESSVENLQMQVKLSLAKLEKIKETIVKVKEHKAEISRNEDFEFYIIVKKPVKVDISQSGQHITNCQQCQVTCHFPCAIPNDDGKRGCSAMGSNGYCRVCPGKCFWNVHFNQKFKWEYQEVKEKQTVKELKENFEESPEEKMSGQGLEEELTAEYEEAQEELLKQIQMSAQCLNRLKEIAQQPSALSASEFIELLIQGEQREVKPGWEQRVHSLMEVKQKAEKLVDPYVVFLKLQP